MQKWAQKHETFANIQFFGLATAANQKEKTEFYYFVNTFLLALDNFQKEISTLLKNSEYIRKNRRNP